MSRTAVIATLALAVALLLLAERLGWLALNG